MPDYKALYEELFDAVTNAIEQLRKVQIDTVDAIIEETRRERSNKISAKIKSDFGIKSQK